MDFAHIPAQVLQHYKNHFLENTKAFNYLSYAPFSPSFTVGAYGSEPCSTCTNQKQSKHE